MSDPDLRETIERFLLGTLDDADRAVVEERLLRDTEYCERLAEVENDLYDGYVRGDLSPSDAERFGSHLKRMPDGAQRLRAARALACISPPKRKRVPVTWAGWAVAAALAVAFAASLWWSAQRPVAGPVTVSVPRPGLPIDALRIARLDLPAVLTRGGAIPTVALPPDGALRLRLELRGATSRALQVTLRRGGTVVWTGTAGHPAPEIAELWIPVSLLAPGEYEAVLHGAGPDQYFAFRVLAPR
jgi:hypothetical protein